ncbi:DUF6069 family protein [Prescottella sp. R16]|uniref:DUF6069 family protein n=1 Tax=Prescottella sp. R16 TaxID=3064529 RepID=UPI00272E288B|nr:DUF6069 family protein [Prescottella sp. R16]
MSNYRNDALPEQSVDPRKLWTGGIATALVAALAAVVGLAIVRDLLDIPVTVPPAAFGNSQAAIVAVYAAIAALVATALLHILILTTPRATNFFVWIGVLATILAALWPFTTTADIGSKICSAAIYFVVGMAIVSLLSGTAAAARPRNPGTPGPNPAR